MRDELSEKLSGGDLRSTGNVDFIVDEIQSQNDFDEYAAIAEEVCLDYTAALQAVAVKDEPNPAKLKWSC